ncbi:unnamed protein product [Effrenium voratum]|nr:unnamed protein product [Effrenium voratum]
MCCSSDSKFKHSDRWQILQAMPSGPALVLEQQWEPVRWLKAAPHGQAAKGAAAVNQARRQGENVETSRKFSASSNRSRVVPNAAKLDEHAEIFRHQTVSHDFKLALQQARCAKKWTQSQLAAAVSEKPSVVNDYESGRAVPNGAVVVKLSKALGVQLPKAK